MDPFALLLAAALAAVTLGYAAVCSAAPFAPCRACRTKPRKRRLCRPCDGTGLRLRMGWRVWNHVRRLHRDHGR
ncbi:hypothetical protein [Allonocardiopsis opalescens]|uniref:Uncharacterized protein n=1 Tax=Allonocardiopsis opalescens TaxID=1144618 RepID=A0A2T0Q781_9ACTN|nr:hypothetical protein [Allonocardiopsis opalescens]PRX99654.1 hypothetical protein CLV72_103259 [Allonocardiopsis opalescens]